MKVLTALVLAQLVVLSVLTWRLMSDERAMTTPAAGPQAAPPTVSAGRSESPKQAEQHASRGINPSTSNELRLREIIREELAAQLASETSAGIAAEAQIAPDPPWEPGYDQQRHAVDQSLVYYTQVGRISGAEMVQLQSDIARLRPDDREAMMRRLIRAINDGAIDGRL